MELLIHPHELSDRWIDLAKELKLKRISLHPIGGMDAHSYLIEMLDKLKTPEFRSKIDKLTENGVEIGYEFHAASYLLPRELFGEHPEYFRMDEKGNRTAHGNFCFSNKEAREIICENAVRLANQLYKNTNEFYFWLDDAKRLSCHCKECRSHSFADHQLTLMNEISNRLRKENPSAKVCYLAYYEAVELPTVKPEEGVFLEYAPFERYLTPDEFAFEGEYLERIHKIIDFFGKENSKVLEYWYDNSIYYRRAGNKLVPFVAKNEEFLKDFEFYKGLGFETLSSFACNLCDEYVKLFGEPDLSAAAKG